MEPRRDGGSGRVWIGLLCAAGACCWLLTPQPGPTARPRADAADVPSPFALFGAADPSPAAADLGPPPPASAPHVRARSALARRYAASSDLRAFVEQARARPEDGGAFYALRALSECRTRVPPGELRELEGDASASHAQLLRRSEYIERSHRRCDGFLDEELSDEAVERLAEEGVAAGDPLMTRYRRWTRAVETGSYGELEGALGPILEAGDPLLLEWVGVTGADYWINGFTASGDVDWRERMHDIWRLVACEMGADCSVLDAGRSLDCLLAARCDADGRAAILTGQRWQSERQREALEREVRRLLAAIRKRDPKLALGRG